MVIFNSYVAKYQRVNSEFLMVFQRVSYNFHIFPWFPYGFPMVSHFPMETLELQRSIAVSPVSPDLATSWSSKRAASRTSESLWPCFYHGCTCLAYPNTHIHVYIDNTYIYIHYIVYVQTMYIYTHIYICRFNEYLCIYIYIYTYMSYIYICLYTVMIYKYIYICVNKYTIYIYCLMK